MLAVYQSSKPTIIFAVMCGKRAVFPLWPGRSRPDNGGKGFSLPDYRELYQETPTNFEVE
jgi:hypothetical protein